MREIKFRAWDIERGKYVYPKLWDGTMPTNWDQFYIIEQYTGLKDKNGKEIYEGDIVNGDGVAKVVFYDLSWCLQSQEWTFPFLDCAIDTCEIIGNIHENPELLK